MKTKQKLPGEITPPMIQKLQLAPGDIVVCSVPRGLKLRAVLHSLQHVLPKGQRHIVKYHETSIAKLADLISIEELHALLAAKEKQLLATPANVLQVTAATV